MGYGKGAYIKARLHFETRPVLTETPNISNSEKKEQCKLFIQ